MTSRILSTALLTSALAIAAPALALNIVLTNDDVVGLERKLAYRAREHGFERRGLCSQGVFPASSHGLAHAASALAGRGPTALILAGGIVRFVLLDLHSLDPQRVEQRDRFAGLAFGLELPARRSEDRGKRRLRLRRGRRLGKSGGGGEGGAEQEPERKPRLSSVHGAPRRAIAGPRAPSPENRTSYGEASTDTRRGVEPL